MQTSDRNHPESGRGVRRRDRHGRGLRGVLAPPGVPLHRTRAELFDELVLQAVARLEPRWEAQLASIEFVVEEIPPSAALTSPPHGAVPLSRLDVPGTPAAPGRRADDDAGREVLVTPGPRASGGHPQPPRIVVYRRPLMARADSEDDLGDLVFDVVVEEFARLLGLDPSDVDAGYGGED